MECNNSSFTISLSPNATYHAVDLVIHRQFKGQYAENLVKWALIETQADNTVDKDGKGKVSVRKEYQIWMRREEMEACCPHLLSLETVKAAPGSSGMQEKVEGGRLGQKMDTGVEGMPDGEEPLLEMAEDIKNLIFRARRLRNRAGPSMNPAVGKMLANTINILSAYAKVGALANTFRENGALDLLLTLLSSLYPDVRQSAGDMLRSLATFDLSSRAYVLLKLAKIDDRDPVHKSTTVQSRQMLLDLFSETASSSESEVLLKGITLPQIPGRFIFSLLKKYLRVTSVKQDDTTSSPLTKMGSTIFQSQEPSEFENFYASDQLVSELFAIFGWFEGSLAKEVQKGVLRAMRGVSIFAGTVPSEQKPTKEIKNPYKTRDEFISDRDYGHYIKATLKPGMKVRARISYESVSQGDYGVYRQTNDGTPPAQFSWDGLGDTYWVFWHQVEILPSPDDEDQEEKDESAIAASLSQPSASRQPYVMRSLPLPGGWGHTGQHKSDKQVEQPFWWEVLCVIKSQAEEQTDAVIEILNDKQLKRFEDLINYSPSYSQVAKVVEHLESVHPYLSHEPLTIKEKSHFRDVYTDKTEKIPPAKEDVTLEDDLNGHFKRDPPYPDPYDREEPLRIQFPFDLDDDPPFGLLHPFPNLARRHRDMPGSLMHLRLLEHSQDGSLLKLTSAKELFEMVLEKMPSSCRLAHQGLRIMKCGCELIRRDSDRQECCVSGLFSFILRLMQIEKTSFTLQCIGIECFFHLVGGFGIDSSLIHLDQSEKKPELVSSATKNVIVTMLCSLASVPEGGGLKALVDGIKCVAECFHTRLPGTQKRSAVTSVRGGLIILTLLLKDKDVVAKLSEWGVPDLLQAVSTEMPEFSGKKDLLVHIGHCIPDFVLETVLGSADVTPEYVSTMNREIISVVKALRKLDDIALKNPLSRIVALINKDILSRDKFVEVSPLFVSLFLRHHGVFYLCQALEMNRSSQFTDQAIMILGSLIKFNEETAADVVLQGGLRAIVNIMCNNSVNRECQKSCLQMIRTLSKDPDHLVVMAAENIITPLKNAKEKFQGDSEICDQASELADLCETEETSRAALHQKILRIIFSGVLQMFLGAIEEARRGGQLICLPKFSPFIKYLSAGSGGAVSALQEQWWEAIEVSSNPQSKDNLLDGRKTTFWESSGRSGTHWIRLHMKQGLVIKKMYLEVSSDATFMPQRVTVHGGSTVDNAQEISTVYIPSTFNGSYEIVSNASKFYAVIVIRIKRCQMGGVDCRIRGIKCQATTTSLWPLFGDIFSARSKLFYRIQLQTWLKNSNLGPLEIFDKLSAVILYEQVFGDNFLHTVQARQCIGQACRSALITPLIEKLTLRSSGAPDLGQSIHDYIGQMQPPLISQWRALAACVSGVGGSSQDIGAGGRTLDMDVLSQDSLEPLDFDKAQKRLVKMSQIRRLCRLLVDCDDNITTKNSIENDDKQDGSKFKGVGSKDDRQAEPTLSPGSGTMALARCWRDIVESEVTVVLKKFDLDSPYSVASEILSIYDRLKQAMFELFGGHSQFALAMKEGFSKSFQSLDEVTGVRFCELLCLCIDSLMDSAGKDTSKLQNLGEHQREALLFHFAEPLQFLHNLDLAHIFEHYYRRHLSSRLLRGRSISLLLERRLAQTFAHCFPHKFPLQMLQDLDESQGLMDRFCDSELLESLDQLMVQASGQSSLPPEIVKLAQKCSLYRQRVFQVYSLNPCFWPVRQSPLPVSHLPPQLAQFCEDYTKFFTSMHECGLQQHERPRRLHFTLHGWAVLVFSGVRLIVSTVQMCILLQFRTVQSHGVRSLQEATQIPYQDLCDALLSLTADRQCILTMTQPDSHATPTPQDDDLISSLQSTPFKVNTLFKVNDGFTKDATAKLKTNKVRFHDVRLAARGHASHPSRADRTIDLAHVFERRRAILDSAIVRILKKEKQMSMDNIAHRIIKGCSVGRFDRGASFGRFDCDYRDVCSRVDRLIVNGYIKRDKTNRQMLIYVPDPSTAEKDKEAVEDPTPESEDKQVKTKELSKEKSKLGSSSKANEEASPSIASGGAGVSSKLQLPRKRPGMGRQPQSKTKRKPTPFTRIYANEWYEQHEAPLLGMLPTSRLLGPDEVQFKIDSLMESVSLVLKVDRKNLELLLHHFQWNKDVLIQQYLDGSSKVLEEAGLSGKAVTSPPNRRRSVSCPVCLLSMPYKDLIWLWCNHACCKSCWQKHLLTQIDLDRSLQCSCPIFGCLARPSRAFFIKVFGLDTDPINKFSKAIVQSYVERSAWLTWCRNPQGCTQVLCRGDGMDTGTCRKCNWSSCFSCTFIESHQPATCEDIQKWAESGGFYVGMDEDAKSKQLANVIAKKCPGCGAQIEKNEGCLHMKCKCGHGFCWNCLKPWRPTHADYFNCSAKVSKAARDHKKFQDYTEQCASHHKSKGFAEKLCLMVKGISASVPIKTLSFLSDACQLLVQCHKMLLYTCVAEYFSKPDTSGYLGFLSENLEGDTNVLQAFLENTLLSTSDVARTISTLPEKRIQDGYCLVSKIENTRDKLLVGSQQQFKLGETSTLSSDIEEEDIGDMGEDECDYDNFDDDDDDEDDEDDDEVYIYSDYEDSFHDGFDDSWDEGYDYDDMYSFF